MAVVTVVVEWVAAVTVVAATGAVARAAAERVAVAMVVGVKVVAARVAAERVAVITVVGTVAVARAAEVRAVAARAVVATAVGGMVALGTYCYHLGTTRDQCSTRTCTHWYCHHRYHLANTSLGTACSSMSCKLRPLLGCTRQARTSHQRNSGRPCISWRQLHSGIGP